MGPSLSHLATQPPNRVKILSCLALTGILHPLCFPPFDLAWVAWVALIPLQWAVASLPPGKAFRNGWLAGTLAFAGTITWVITAMNQFGQVPFWISFLLMLLLATYLGLFVGFYSWGYAKLYQHVPLTLILTAPAWWVTLEYARTYAFSGLPWALFGYSQYQWLSLIQIADITGVYGVSFLVVMGNVALTALWEWILNRKTQSGPVFPKEVTVAFVLTLVSFVAYGLWQLQGQHSLDEGSSKLTIGLVQANIAQDKKWNEAYRDETLARYASLSKKAAQQADLLIWPEAATPFLFNRELTYQKKVLEITQQTDTPLIFGSPSLRFHQDGTPYLLNSAYVLDREGSTTGRYDKRHLVPFGEYIPLKSILFFLDKLVVGIGDFQAGQGSMTLTVPSTASENNPRFGVAICFEVIFPDLVRRMAKEGANFLVTITNDAWFGDSAAPYQHFGMVVFRAVENHLAFARAANTGISGFITPTGQILAETPIFTEQALTGTITLRSTPQSFYTQFGDVFSWGCVILSGLVFVRGRQTYPS